jgi:FtsP/CotA-like multicopper oxidase with cupredoxin domain
LPIITRRTFLGSSIGAGTAALGRPLLAAGHRDRRLVIAPTRLPLVATAPSGTDVWAYNSIVPGPVLRYRQGEQARITVENRLSEGTTVHWHGVRVPNAMDGVPGLTQEPIAPNGGTFTYEFTLPDAGTYWYHPHERSFEQVERGLAGALIVEEPSPLGVDRDLVWILDDWRLRPDGSLSSDFGAMFDVTHAGRLGNTVTVNGKSPDTWAVRAHERIRLRLINAANARIFALEFRNHRPIVIALDGQPIEPHEPDNGRIVLGPAMRADIILDMTAEPASTHAVIDGFYPRQTYKLLDLVYAPSPAVRDRILEPPTPLPPNPLSEPDILAAERHDIALTGGMMGGPINAMVHGRQMDMREMLQHGAAWAINGTAVMGHAHDPLLTLRKGRSYVLSLRNETAWHHPMHLHGHTFRVIARNGKPTARREWQDTVLLNPRETAEIAFVADNPGHWMFHCHILEHQAGGMMGSIHVA